MENVNVFSLILSSLTPMIVGSLYYSKFLFGKTWMASIGMTEEKQKQANMILVMGLSILGALLLSIFFLNFNNGYDQEGQYDTFGHGAWHGAFIGVVVVMPVFVSNGLFEQKSWKNIVINVAYWIITLALMGGIMDALNHFPNAPS